MPVVAALRGACLGGGLQIALGADIRIAAPDTKLSVMEIVHGLIPDMSITQTLPRLVGDDVARELVFTGRKVEAAEAFELGLVTRIAEVPEAEARALAAEIAARRPEAVRNAKRLLNEAPALSPGRGAGAGDRAPARAARNPGRAPTLRGRTSPRAALKPPHGWFRCGSKRASGRSRGASTRW